MTMGLVQAANQLQAYGRGPDKNLAHISPDESTMLDYMQGGRKTNPITGLPEYSLFGKILKTVIRVGATIGAGVATQGNPAAMAAANAAATKLTGGSWKQAAISGVTTGVTAGMGNYASTGSAWSSSAPSGGLESQVFGKAAGFDKYGDALTRGSTEIAATAAPTTLGEFGTAALTELKNNPLPYSAQAAGDLLSQTAADKAKAAKGPPDWFTQYGNQQLPYDPNNIPEWMKNRIAIQTGRPFMQSAQAREGSKFDPTSPTDIGLGYAMGGQVAPTVGLGSTSPQQLMSAAQWGYVNAAHGGIINGPGDGKSDDIPAMLSNNEHVIDAGTVADAGNGDSNAGHRAIEKIKTEIRRNAGRKNPAKPSPRQKAGLGMMVKRAMSGV